MTVYVGGLLEVDSDSSGVTATRAFYAFTGILAAVDDGDIAFVAHDHLGSPVAAFNDTAKALAARRFTPFGNERLATGSLPNDRRFTGLIDDGLGNDSGGSDLTFSNARYYSPELGAFASPDSLIPALGTPAALNRYAYVYNAPTVYSDPNGKAAVDWWTRFWPGIRAHLNILPAIVAANPYRPLVVVDTKPSRYGIPVVVGDARFNLRPDIRELLSGGPDPIWELKPDTPSGRGQGRSDMTIYTATGAGSVVAGERDLVLPWWVPRGDGGGYELRWDPDTAGVILYTEYDADDNYCMSNGLCIPAKDLSEEPTEHEREPRSKPIQGPQLYVDPWIAAGAAAAGVGAGAVLRLSIGKAAA